MQTTNDRNLTFVVNQKHYLNSKLRALQASGHIDCTDTGTCSTAGEFISLTAQLALLEDIINHWEV